VQELLTLLVTELGRLSRRPCRLEVILQSHRDYHGELQVVRHLESALWLNGSP
jgi:hypothetical protein